MSVLSNANVIFSNISTVDKLSGKYQLVVGIDESQAADAEEAGLKVKVKEFDGKTQFQVTFKTKFKEIQSKLKGLDGVTPVDLEGGELARGSTVNIQYAIKTYNINGNDIVSQHLDGIQVLERATGGTNEFGDVSGAAGGDAEGDM